ncbi:MAG: HDOD domain-containing protein, partial [Verrucomicrobiales bacterium]|nr:HDOD domain-containing protein [Verrucomicrobiales bacterium]
MNKVFYELKFSGKLPSPAGVGMQILQLTQQEDCGVDEITKVVRSDPSLTGRILKVANTFATARTNNSAPTAPPLEEAVLRIGFASLRDLVLGFSLISNNPKAICRAFDYGAFWHVSLGRAVAAQYLTELAGRGAGSESYVCGLLCGMGRLGLAAAHPERYSKILESEGADDPESLVAMETREFGINHRELTDALLSDWGFPQRLARAAATYQQTTGGDASEPGNLKLLRRILRAADGVVAAINANVTTAEGLPEALKTDLTELDVGETQLTNALTSIRTTWREWGALLNVSAPKPAGRGTTPADGDANSKIPPRKDAVRPRDATPVVEASGAAGASVLLLEADDRIATGFEGWLRRAGHQVVRSRNIRDALALAVTHSPQIVIAHGQNDDTEALEFCKAMRSFEAGRMTFYLLATPNADSRKLLA